MEESSMGDVDLAVVNSVAMLLGQKIIDRIECPLCRLVENLVTEWVIAVPGVPFVQTEPGRPPATAGLWVSFAVFRCGIGVNGR